MTKKRAQRAATSGYLVAGRLRGGRLASIDGLDVVVLNAGIRKRIDVAHGRLTRDAAFEIAFELALQGDDLPDLAVEIRHGEKLLATSGVRIDVPPGRVVIDVEVPGTARAARAEYEALGDRLRAAGLDGTKALDVKARPDDLAYLARKTQWDARAIAMFILAGRLSEQGAPAARLEPDLFYALFRSGVPAQANAVLRVAPANARAAWAAAADAGVIAPRTEGQLKEAVARFQVLVQAETLSAPRIPGASPLGEVLAVSFRKNAALEATVVKLLARFGSDAKRFWTAVEQELGADERRRLALDSDLAALTLHNAPLMQAVRQTALPDDAAGLEPLAEAGLAQPQAWEALLKNVPIPAPVTGETEDTRRARYAELLAEQVRLAFPLTALARRVDDGVAAVNGKSRAAVSDFLRKQNGKYRLGEEPLVRYLERTGEKLDPNLSREIRRLERVHQLTPNDPAMDALLRADLDSAYRIAQLEEAGFVERFAKSLGADVAASIHSKAREVHNATVNVVLGYQTAQAGVVIGAGNAPIVQPQVSQQAMTNANAAVAATLETLFGELDYCACEHCRSVLGPAAYLVDLLALCDPVAGDIPAGKRAPIAELRRRRPDIEHLPLTCNNTNTAVPVIDLVNETLEYFVVAAPAEQPGKPAMSLDGFKGYSTSGDVSQQDLLAEPQHVRAAAYAGLQGAFFPLALPFNEPLEAERRYLAPFDRSLAGVMEAMRVNDDLERGGATPYGWRDILMEELSLSRQQHALLTDRTITVRQLYGFPAAGVGDPVVPPELRNVKQFTRRLGLSFEELTALLRTRFVNPNIWVLPLAERLGVTLARIKEFAVTADTAANNTAFEAGVSAGLDAALYGGSIAAWTRLHAPTILGLLTLFDTAAQPDPCNFDAMEFRYGDPAANGGAVLDLEFVRLIRFVRLWKALSWPATAGTEDDGARGWTIAETDAALTALYPVNQLPLSGVDATDLQRLDDGMRQALLRLGSMVRVLRLLEIGDRAELPSLLACFAPMQGIEEGALYRRLFMSAEFLRLYPAFQPDTAGRALPDPAVTLATQAEAMRAACGLAGDDWTALQGSGRFPANTTLANVPTNAQLQALVGHVPTAREAEYVLRFVRTDTVSAVYRRAWLARTLGISPRELESLAAATGLDPFADPGVVTAATPPNPAESFVRLVLELRGSGLALAEALLAFFNLDLLAASGASEAAARGVAAAVRSDLADVDRALVVTDDPDSAVAQALLASVYDATVADRYIAHINRRARVDVEYVAPGGALPAAVPQAGDGGLDYDDFAQRLGYSKGVMPAAVRDALTAPGLNQPQAFNDAVLALYAQSRVFLQQLGPDALLQAHDAFQASAAADPARRRQLLADLTTALKPVRKRLAALARGTAALRLTGDWPAAALTDAAALPANRDAAQPGLFDLLALDRRGVVGEFFFGALGAVADVRDGAAGALDYRAAGARSLPANAANPGQPIAARWRGFVRVPAPGAFTLFIEADAAAAPALWIEGSSIALQPVSAGLWRTAGAQSFDAGRLIAFTLEATGLGARATLSVQTATVQRAVVAADDLFDAAIMQDFVSTLGRLQRAELLRTKLSLNEAEILFLLRAPALRITVDARPWAWLGVVPVLAPAAAVAAPLGRVLSTLLAYLRVRRELGAEAEEMLALLGDPAATLSDAASAFMRRSSWEAATVDAVLTRLGLVAGGQPDRNALRSIASLARVHDVLRPMLALRAPYALLVDSATNAPTDAAVRAVYSALRSRYGANDWSTLMKPINDRVRARRRDALVASVLHGLRTDPDPVRRAVDSADRLYEYLLLDPLMHPRVETSRIRQALASVQQFIQRLVEIPGSEAADIHVPPAMREQWPWMKRYRVWEANRKVFLYPENWMEPELRDDQSAIFRETMGELLQGDINDERAAEAMIGYLRKLEQLTQLEPAAIHVDTRETGSTTDDVLHVIARSSGANRKYYYRRRNPGSWMPWEAVKLDIEDNPVLPVRWKNRLFLFWVKIFQEANPAQTPSFSSDRVADQSAASIPASPPLHTVKAILCWSEQVGGKWTDARTSSPDNAAVIGTAFTAMGGENPFIRGDYRLVASISDDQLRVYFGPEATRGMFLPSCGFRLFNSFAEPDQLPMRSRTQNKIYAPLRLPMRRLLGGWEDALMVYYYEGDEDLYSHPLLRRADGQRGAWCPPRHDIHAAWHNTAPFFYWDSRYTLLVTPTLLLEVNTLPWDWVTNTRVDIVPQTLQYVEHAADAGGPNRALLHVLPTSATLELDGQRIDAGGVMVQLEARIGGARS